MPRRRKKPERAGQAGGRSICIDLSNIAEYVRYAYFYKANAASLVVTGFDLWKIGNDISLDHFVDEFNSKIFDWAGKKAKKPEQLQLSPEDFSKCDVALSSKEVVEVKEHLKSTKYLYKLETSKTFRTVPGFKKLAEVANMLFRVSVGDDVLHTFIDVDGRRIEDREKIINMNRQFLRLASGGLGYTELYMLATALAARHSPGRLARLVLIKEKYFTSMPLGAFSNPEERAGEDPRVRAFYNLFSKFADFYIGLVEAKSQYTEAVASALLTYIQTQDFSRLFSILRNMTQTEKLTSRERQVLNGLLEQFP
jgi:hypothetical protein